MNAVGGVSSLLSWKMLEGATHWKVREVFTFEQGLQGWVGLEIHISEWMHVQRRWGLEQPLRTERNSTCLDQDEVGKVTGSRSYWTYMPNREAWALSWGRFLRAEMLGSCSNSNSYVLLYAYHMPSTELSLLYKCFCFILFIVQLGGERPRWWMRKLNRG